MSCGAGASRTAMVLGLCDVYKRTCAAICFGK
jgi:hypothetical protein